MAKWSPVKVKESRIKTKMNKRKKRERRRERTHRVCKYLENMIKIELVIVFIH